LIEQKSKTYTNNIAIQACVCMLGMMTSLGPVS
jgi:hypothetical protein